MKRWKQGSLTVEAALICPVFIFAMLFFVYTIIWFQQAALVQADIVSKARAVSSGYPAAAYGDVEDVSDIVIPWIYKADFIPVKIVQKVVTRPFVGVNSLMDESEAPVVYVTPNGKVYHYDITCSYISVKTHRVNYSDISYLRNKSGSIYKECKACIHSGNNQNRDVFVTDYGTRFHGRADCTCIKHEIMTIRLSKVNNMRACSKCSKGR